VTTVTIHLLSTDDHRYLSDTYTSTHRTTDEGEAISRAVHKHFGKRAFFHRDSGIRHGYYGQIFRNITRSGETFTATSVTGRIRVDVD
jgi:hypothetical protein